MGLIIPGAAEQFGVEVTSMASQFTWFTGGVFLGYILSFVLFDYFSIKRILIAGYLVCIASLIAVHLTESFVMLGFWLTLFGVAISIAGCGSSTMITRLWTGRARQTVLVAQDAMFNGGGVIFSAVTTWFVTRSFPFSGTYLVVAGLITFVVVLVAWSDFEEDVSVDFGEARDIETEWNSGIILTGISLLLFMLAKISIFIWAPQYVEQHFSVNGSVSGKFMSNIFTAALIGSLAGTWLVSRVNVKYILYTFVGVSAVSVLLFTQTEDIEVILLLALVYGISVSATFNAYVAYALTFVSVPTHRNIAYMLLMSALGSSAAPLFSSQAVKLGGNIGDALTFCFVTLLIVILTLVASEMLASKIKGSPDGDSETEGSA
jgi:MFS transporter, TsgA protein